MGQLVFQATAGGQVALVGPNPASNFSINVPAINGTFVTTGDTGTVTSTMLATSVYTAPGTIGSVTPNTGAFTTLSASSTVSGAGFSNYLASPPAIGGTTAAAGSFTTLSGSTSVTTPIVKSASSLTLQTNGTTTAVTIDTSQNVGIGTTPNTWTGALKALQIGSTSSLAGGSGEADLYCNVYNNGTNIVYQTSSYASQFQMNNLGEFRWYNAPSGTAGTTATLTERMRIDSSGNLLVNTTNIGSTAFKIGVDINSGQGGIGLRNLGGSTAIQFWYGSGNTGVGYISTTSSSTAYNTSSDYRLKENIAPMTGALDKVLTLKPVTYKWKIDGSNGEGFIAHELAEVVPDCVTGEKDAVETIDEFDSEGKVIGIKEVPKYQGVDTSFLVATLTAAIQELNAKVIALEAKVGA